MSSSDESQNELNESGIELPQRDQPPLSIGELADQSLSPDSDIAVNAALCSPADGIHEPTSEPVIETFPEFPEDVRQKDRPVYQLYSPGCVAWAAFWGGFLGGGFVLACNYLVLRRRWEAVMVFLAMGCLAVTAMSVTALFSKTPTSAWSFSIATTLLVWSFAWLLQSHLCRSHEKSGGASGSGTGAFGFGLLGMFLTFGLLVGFNSAFRFSLGTRLIVGRNDEVYYSGGISVDEARRLGDFLKADGFFDSTRRQSVVLSKAGETILVSYFYEEGQWNDPTLVKNLEAYSTTLSAEVFSQKPVQALMRESSSLRIRRRLNPRTGVSTKAWARDFEAGAKAYGEGQFHDAEMAYRASVKEAERHESLQPQLVWSLNNVGTARLNQELTDDVEPHFQRAILLAETVFGEKSYEVSYALDELGRWELKRGNLPEAEAFYRRALAIREKVQDERTPGQSEIRNSLISLLIDRESFSNALELQDLEVTWIKKKSDTDPAKLASGLRLLGWLCWRTGKYEESKKHFEDALAAFERTSDTDSDEFLTCLWQAGLVSHTLGEFETAEHSFRRAITLLENEKDSNGLLRANFQEALADLLGDQAKYDESEKIHQQVLEQRERNLDKDHIAVGKSLGRLGAIALQLGRYPEAEIQLQRAIDIFEKSETHVRRQLADCLHDFAHLRHIQARYMEAEKFYRKALAIREDVLGADHDQVATTISALSELCSDRGDYAAAEPLSIRAHEIAKKRFGEEHPFLLTTLHRLGLVQLGQGKLDQAEQTLRRALEIGSKTLGYQHPYLAESQNALAVVLLRQNRMADAEPVLEQAIKSFEAILGPDHPSLIGPLNNLGSIYESRSRDSAAEEHLERALKMADKLVDNDHPYLLPILANYAKVLRKLNRADEAEKLELRIEKIRSKHKLDDRQPSGSVVI